MNGLPAQVSMGDVVLLPAGRQLRGPQGEVNVEPRVVQVLVALSQQPGLPLPRQELLMRCWGTSLAGDDSLNRSIYQLRKALAEVGSATVTIETVSAMGYVLRVAEAPISAMCEAARRSWRMGLAQADERAINGLQSALSSGSADSAEAWGLLALQYCRAAEYAPIERCSEFVTRCEQAAQRALALDSSQPDARVALSSLGPIYGDWLGARTRLMEVLADTPAHFAARHELAVLAMSTGCVSSAVPLIEALIQEDPLAATLHYKRGYHLYCLGQVDMMDRVLDNALQLWPGHPGIWQSRTMTFAFTGRAAAARALLDDDVMRPPMPATTLQFHRIALDALATGNVEGVVHEIRERANWQSLAVAAIMYLCAVGEPEEAFDLCERYYIRDGQKLVRLRYEPGIEASINEMHRRATQSLFLPVTANLRSHPNFMTLCGRMGLVNYWESAGVTPDFLA